MKKEYLFFLIFPLSQILMISGDYMTTGSTDALINLGVISSIIADVVLLFVLIHGAKKDKVEKELEKVKYLNKVENARNEMMESRQKELYAMKEDFERRMNEINEMMAKGDTETKEKQLEEFQEMLEKTRPNLYCNHAVVNAILNEKERACKELGFSMEIDTMIPRELKVEPLHMCSIFSNLLDNAIEAVSELPVEERIVKVSAEVNGHYLLVKVTNPTTKAYVNRKKRKDRGYGTLILKDIAKKYDGEYTAAYENGYYSASIAAKV